MVLNSAGGLLAILSKSKWNHSKFQLRRISEFNGKLNWSGGLTANCKFALWDLYSGP